MKCEACNRPQLQVCFCRVLLFVDESLDFEIGPRKGLHVLIGIKNWNMEIVIRKTTCPVRMKASSCEIWGLYSDIVKQPSLLRCYVVLIDEQVEKKESTFIFSSKIIVLLLFFYFNLRTAAFKAYCAIWVRRSNFCHQASPRVSPRESTQRRKVEL
jgi:hypothetical protein